MRVRSVGGQPGRRQRAGVVDADAGAGAAQRVRAGPTRAARLARPPTLRAHLRWYVAAHFFFAFFAHRSLRSYGLNWTADILQLFSFPCPMIERKRLWLSRGAVVFP